MKVYLDSVDETVTIAELRPKFSGGEGSLYEIIEFPGQLAKIYASPTSERQRKAQAMVDNPPPTCLVGGGYAQIVWPHGLVWEDCSPQKFCGIEIPLVPNMRPLHTLWGSGVDELDNYRKLVLCARNLAWGVEVLHASGFVLVDLAPANILVDTGYRVAFVDTDSYQFQLGENVFSGNHGRESYTAPEVLNAPRNSAVARRQDQDAWALATLIFQLLLATHPFTCRHTGSGEKPKLAERIRRGLWAYTDPPPPGYAPTPRAMPFDVLSEDLQHLMQRTFQRGYADPAQRPTATDWRKALEELLPDDSQVLFADAVRAKYTRARQQLRRAISRVQLRFLPKKRAFPLKTFCIAIAVCVVLAVGAVVAKVAWHTPATDTLQSFPVSYSAEEYGEGRPTPKLWRRFASPSK